MGKIIVGTASWTDKGLIASRRFYPRGCNGAEDRLRFYASQFPLVEVDSSYYAMPSAANSILWVERTPPDFVFNIKAFRLFTGHQTPWSSLPKDIAVSLGALKPKNWFYKDFPRELRDEMWRRYREAIDPLRSAGKLAAVHFQFAPWVVFHSRSMAHIDECQRELPGYQLAIEFRNRSWFDADKRETTLAFERERGLVNVIVDEPQGTTNSIPAVWEVTQPALSILRLHGRNHMTWNVKGVSSAARFNYDYNNVELDALARKAVALPADLTQVIFNNNFEDQGQRNATTMKQALEACSAY